MIKAFDHAEVLTRDIAETRDFYVDKLGFELWRETNAVRPDGGSWSLACVKLGSVMVEILQAQADAAELPAEQTRVGCRMFALRVDDMAETIAELESKGVEISRPPTQQTVYDGLRAEIKDPNGISIELREWQKGDSIANFDWTPSDPGTTVVR